MRIRNWRRGVLVLSGLLIAILLPLLVAYAQGDGEKQKVPKGLTDHLKGLTKITPKRVAMDPQAAMLCSNAAGAVRLPSPKPTPHQDAEILVYCNEQVVQYRKDNPIGADYPVGSVFLKEKYSDDKTEIAHLATVMRRIGDKGMIDDWDFSTMDLPGGELTEMTANDQAACADCHANFKKRGFVSSVTDYLLARLVDPASDQTTGNMITVAPENVISLGPQK